MGCPLINNKFETAPHAARVHSCTDYIFRLSRLQPILRAHSALNFISDRLLTPRALIADIAFTPRVPKRADQVSPGVSYGYPTSPVMRAHVMNQILGLHCIFYDFYTNGVVHSHRIYMLFGCRGTSADGYSKCGRTTGVRSLILATTTLPEGKTTIRQLPRKSTLKSASRSALRFLSL